MGSIYHITLKGALAFVKSDGDTEQQVESLAMYLGSSISIEPGTLFEHLWAFVERDAEMFSIIFYDQLAGRDLLEYVEQSKKPGDMRRRDEDGMERLEVGWSVECDTYEGETSVYVGPDFRGRGESGFYGFSFTTVNDMKGYEITLDESCQFHHTDLGDHKTTTLPKGSKGFTVYEVLAAIFDELGWNDPKGQRGAKMLAQIDQVREGVERGDVKLIPLDEAGDTNPTKEGAD